MLLEDFEIYLKSKGYLRIYLNYQPFNPDDERVQDEGIFVELEQTLPIQPFNPVRDDIYRFIIRHKNRQTALEKANDIMYLFNSFRGLLQDTPTATYIFISQITEPVRLLDVLGSTNISEYIFKIQVKYLDKNLNTLQSSLETGN